LTGFVRVEKIQAGDNDEVKAGSIQEEVEASEKLVSDLQAELETVCTVDLESG